MSWDPFGPKPAFSNINSEQSDASFSIALKDTVDNVFVLPAILPVQAICYQVDDVTRRCYAEVVDHELAREIKAAAAECKSFDTTTNSSHLSIDLAQDFTITTFDPKKMYYAMPNQIADAVIENITSFSICEPYFLKYSTEGSNTWHNFLRRMTVTFSKHPRINGNGSEWRMTSPTWEEKFEIEAPIFNPHVERITRADIEKEVIYPLSLHLDNFNDSVGCEVLTPVMLWTLQKCLSWTRADQRLAAKAFMKGDREQNAPLRKFEMEEVEDQDEGVVETKDGTKFVLKTRAEAGRRYRVAEWKGNETVWTRLAGREIGCVRKCARMLRT